MNNLIILCYHGVSKSKSNGIENYNFKHLNYKIFERHIKKIKNYYNPISMNEVIMYIREKIKFPKNSVAITFDDGFKNNIEVAAPILEKYYIPATFYISTGFVNSNKMFWVDEVEDCINRTKKEKICILMKKNEQIFNLTTKFNKLESLKKIKKQLKKTNIENKNQFIKKLIKSTRIKPNIKSSQNYKKLSNKDIIDLANNNLFTIGSHGVNHESMTLLSPNKLQIEINKSINYLELLLKRDITHYSYPEGQKNDFNENVIKALKQMNIQCCPTAIPGKNNHHQDLFRLKRYMIGLDNKYNII